MMDAIKIFLFGVDIFFVVYLIGYSSFLFLSVLWGSNRLYTERMNEKLKNSLHQDFYIPISIIVPAHNEEITVVDTVCTLLKQDYKLYEIVVVDDGSEDHTAKRLIEYFHMYKIDRPVRKRIPCKKELAVYEAKEGGIQLTLVMKENGGKADTLNMGINISRFPYFICIDADSMLQRDSLREIAKPVLEDNRTIACGGQVRVSNGVRLIDGRVQDYSLPKKIIIALQVLEYDRSFMASRIFMDSFNGNLIISGAFGLFEKNTVVLAGGYDNSTMGEDMELVVKLHAFCRLNHLDYRIRYTPDAVCWSQAPGNLPDLMRQRRRWHIGLYESLTKYKAAVGRKEYGIMGTVSFLYFWIYELLSPYIEIFGILTIILSFWANLINIPFMLLFFAVYALFGCTLTLVAFFSRIHTQQLHITVWDGVKAILLSGFELVGLRFILMLVRVNALLGYQKNKNVWGEKERYRHNRE
ncbi:glycosyltransferase family 2 protein [Murimonas intestini]|uniref:glycosyltransferase family 2 protein n=1 Tax=Murimonas intestini TaxID=1337051 RepID=UPI0011DDE342|nr:glycosyltransferase [Murimonas intestini]